MTVKWHINGIKRDKTDIKKNTYWFFSTKEPHNPNLRLTSPNKISNRDLTFQKGLDALDQF
jgi:hypothetical protein